MAAVGETPPHGNANPRVSARGVGCFALVGGRQSQEVNTVGGVPKNAPHQGPAVTQGEVYARRRRSATAQTAPGTGRTGTVRRTLTYRQCRYSRTWRR